MKKLLAFVLTAALVCAALPALAQNLYTEKAAELADRLCTLAADKAYLQMMGANPDMLEAIRPLGALSGRQPVAMHTAQLPESGLAAANALGVVGMLDSLSDTARTEAAKRMYGAIPTMIGSARGNIWIAVSAMLSGGEAYVMPENFAPCAVFVQYEGDVGVLVTFTRAGEGVMGAGACFFHAEDIKSPVWAQMGVTWND